MSLLEFFPRARPVAPGRRSLAAGYRSRADLSTLAVKRAIDLVFSLAGLLLLAPVLLLIGAAVCLTSRGPMLFRQVRVGRNGRPFVILKFRTFSDGAVTALGRFLRRWNLDELPQLWNVVRGEMALVGPRPLLPDMTVDGVAYQDLVGGYAFRHAVRPGITGLAQVSGFRGLLVDRRAAEMRLKLDFEYIATLSIGGDLCIIGLTLWQELRSPSGS